MECRPQAVCCVQEAVLGQLKGISWPVLFMGCSLCTPAIAAVHTLAVSGSVHLLALVSVLALTFSAVLRLVLHLTV